MARDSCLGPASIEGDGSMIHTTISVNRPFIRPQFEVEEEEVDEEDSGDEPKDPWIDMLNDFLKGLS